MLERQLAPESNKLTGGGERQAQESREGKVVSTKFFVNKHQMNKQSQWLCATAVIEVGRLILAGLPRARSARGTEPHTHGIWSTSFRLVVT